MFTQLTRFTQLVLDFAEKYVVVCCTAIKITNGRLSTVFCDKRLVFRRQGRAWKFLSLTGRTLLSTVQEDATLAFREFEYGAVEF